MDKKDVRCKRIFGMTVCKFKNGQQITLPTNKKYGIPVTIYTSKKINLFPHLRKKIEKINKQLNKPFLIRELDVEKHPTPNSVMTIPTIVIGNEIITDPNFDKHVLLHKASLFY